MTIIPKGRKTIDDVGDRFVTKLICSGSNSSPVSTIEPIKKTLWQNIFERGSENFSDKRPLVI
ncbi:hypothetical protein NBRC116597_13980 [Phaeobacter sp. NW0010-22]